MTAFQNNNNRNKKECSQRGAKSLNEWKKPINKKNRANSNFILTNWINFIIYVHLIFDWQYNNSNINNSNIIIYKMSLNHRFNIKKIGL